MTARRIVALVTVVAAAALVLPAGGCGVIERAQTISRELETPQWEPLTDAQKIELIDGMRDKGSYEATRERLTGTARLIADRISAAVPGQTWKFSDDPYLLESHRNGGLCEKLSADIARRPITDTIVFGSTFSGEGFKTAAGVVADEAADYGADSENSLFNESSKRDYTVQGNGYEFKFGQVNFATLSIEGDCFLLQRVLDSPPGQLPPPSPTSTRSETPTP